MNIGRQTSPYRRHPDDWYVEPPGVIEALLEVESPFIGRVMDPCCGRGTIPLTYADTPRHTAKMVTSDIVKRWDDVLELAPYATSLPRWRPDSVITNPPFREAQAFIECALENTTDRVCVLLPLNFLGSEKRYLFFKTRPLARIWHLVPRISMLPGDMPPRGSGMTEYAWFVFQHAHTGSCIFQHLPHKRGAQARRETSPLFEETHHDT
ncbi:hypothetical protein CGLAMM_07345 [Acetobacteraceae bacterium EV16G]|uniref:Methyltransferase n=1 Tax=Sorlinia euscelidii TaxID=3081148 RepID=A0ABU7U467_9PROT